MYISASGGKREAEGESIVSADIFRSLAICNLLKPFFGPGRHLVSIVIEVFSIFTVVAAVKLGRSRRFINGFIKVFSFFHLVSSVGAVTFPV